ncbi:O-methyltransferase-domain-containing protein [Xylariaceae sp. FL0662B]|nr:O-methyltransferase-domain-containing protein [Xylariaceae sp. FL0662B]
MAAIQTPSLVAQATAILDAATSLQQQLEKHGLQQPSFEVNGRKGWQDAVDQPNILKARSALIDASNLMLDLALGPMDTLSSLAGPTVSKVDVLRTLDALNVPQHVPLERPIAINDLATKVGVNVKLLQQQLRFAYLVGIFHEPREGFVAHTSVSAAMPTYSPWIRMRLGYLMSSGAWKIPEALKTWQDPPSPGHIQIPVALADSKHRNFWRVLEEDDPDGRGMEKFSVAMKALFAGHSGNSFSPFVQGFDWAALGNGLIIDVGGGNGHIEANIMNKIPSGIDFLIQDLATNEGPANAVIKHHGAEGRVKFQIHDFFTAQPSELRPRAYILSRILHDWQDTDCVKILRQLLPAMKEYGTKLLIVERVLPDHIGDIPNHQEQLIRTQDLLMFTLFGGGERSLSDWDALFKKVDAKMKIAAVRSSQLSPFSYMEVVIE